jgi:hypothetical protein
MAPLVQKDACRQVEGLIRTIDDRPACRLIERLRDAGRGSPYEGATEMTIAHTYDAAGNAGSRRCLRASMEICRSALARFFTQFSPEGIAGFANY